MRKLQSPKLSPSQFEPELVWTMRSVLDAAVDQIDTANRTPATKAKMAERILRAASDGITDPMMLTAIAIEERYAASGLGDFSAYFGWRSTENPSWQPSIDPRPPTAGGVFFLRPGHC